MDMNALLAPKSVALVGASTKTESLGYQMIEMIKKSGYEGEVYLINPRYEEILGYKCYPSLESIGKSVDTVALCISTSRIEEQVDIALHCKAKSLIIFANCVIEGEDPNNTLENRLLKKCQDAGVAMLGHNAMGYYNNDINLRICGFLAPDFGMKGNISFISQSGSVFSTMAHNEPQLKYNFLLATGTGQITSLSDYMIYALGLETTKVLSVYMESVRKPERFKEALALAQQKGIPIIIMKVGKSELGAEFAQSHTGGLVGDDDAIQAVIDHYGAIRVDSFDEMSNLMLLFSYYPHILPGGLVAIADSGGERNLLADVAENVGLQYAHLSNKTMSDLETLQEPGQHAANPLDPWGTGIDFERIFADSLVCMLRDDNAAIGIISQDLRDDYFLSQGVVQSLEQAAHESKKPVAFMSNFGGQRRSELTKRINKIPAPVLIGTYPTLLAIHKYLSYRDFKYSSNNTVSYSLSKESIKLLSAKRTLLEHESLQVLSELGIPTPEIIPIQSVNDIKNNPSIPYPVVLKTSKKGILHKSDVGGVALNIKDESSLITQYTAMSHKLGIHCIVSPMYHFDIELILGMKIDPIFGPLIIVGAGGILTEIIKDTIVLLPNSSLSEIKYKLKTLKTYELFNEFRGIEKVNIDKLAEVILNFCMGTKILSPDISEIDINPLVLKGDMIVALDGLLIGESH
ncbi:MAG: acetate--CoA ligase family protein [Brevinema sp.]